MDKIAHLIKRDNKWEIQTLEEHSKGVAELAKTFADEFNRGEWGYVLGMYHDQGKQTTAFQNHIKHVSGYDESCPDDREESKHSNIGGLLAWNDYNKTGVGKLLHDIIASHHTHLKDKSDYANDLMKNIPEEVKFEPIIKNLALPSSMPERDKVFSDATHFVRMLYSCLCDADYLDTEYFMNPQASEIRNRNKSSLTDLLPKLRAYINSLNKNAKKTLINELRCKISDLSENCGSSIGTNLVKLIVPTGAGKTLSSIIFAFAKAIKEGKKRIIIATPYITITSQTAKIYKSIFGPENVLEIHSNYEPSEDEYDILKKIDLTSQNFDAPIVVTTDVQLLESMHTSKPFASRKLHNIANSVVIFDEIQKLPFNYLQSLVYTFDSYQRLFNTTFLFMSATELPLDKQYDSFKGLTCVCPIIPSDMDIFTPFRRNTYYVNEIYRKQILARVIREKNNSIMCVVGTKNIAKELYRSLDNGSESNCCYHLSKNMCVAHIDNTLDTIKERLVNNKNVKLITTSLIEAGVDVDFPEIYAMENGLNSIVQAAGRCNREGKLPRGLVHVFKLINDEGRVMRTSYDGDVNLRVSIFEDMLLKHNNDNDFDYASQEAISEFYNAYFGRSEKSKFDKSIITENGNAIKIIEETNCLNFEKIDKGFKLIDNDEQFTVIVPYEDGINIISEIEDNNSYMDFQRITRYTVQINEKRKNELEDEGFLTPVFNSQQLFYLNNPDLYDEKIGLLSTDEAIFII